MPEKFFVDTNILCFDVFNPQSRIHILKSAFVFRGLQKPIN
jgi:hypothetical protein